jgi:hypothetical protein
MNRTIRTGVLIIGIAGLALPALCARTQAMNSTHQVASAHGSGLLDGTQPPVPPKKPLLLDGTQPPVPPKKPLMLDGTQPPVPPTKPR